MDLQKRLDDLQGRVAAALRYLPGATALYMFGSRSTAQADAYADIDLQVYTVTFPAAQAVWPHFLTRVGPVEVAWPIDAALDITTYSVLFREESYYHKVDISLCAGEPPPNDSPSLVSLWTQSTAPGTLAAPPAAIYIPPIGSVAHMVLDELIASVRYVYYVCTPEQCCSR